MPNFFLSVKVELIHMHNKRSVYLVSVAGVSAWKMCLMDTSRKTRVGWREGGMQVEGAFFRTPVPT